MKKNDQKKIMVIEDDANLLKNVKEILEEENFLVNTATDGKRGIKTVLEWQPDLIICDIALPLKNGYEVAQEILKNEKTKKTPFIFLTAKVEKEDIRKGMMLGADDYIFKPFDIADLLNSIRLRLDKMSNQNNMAPTEEEKKQYEMDDKLLLKAGSKIQFFKIKDLKYLKAENPYVLLKFEDGKNSLQRQTLDKWESKLPLKYFIRIHRSTIINMEFIVKI
ncbi:MAG: response regulator, partial [Ignavibacteriaceae bacterium]|nr:response regulator [Ignavibacteriaceae bacterium]